MFHTVVVAEREKKYGWDKEKLNKCLPQHIKLNIYLQLKGKRNNRAKKKPLAIYRVICLCCVACAWFLFCPFPCLSRSISFGLHTMVSETSGRCRTEVKSHKIMCSKTHENTRRNVNDRRNQLCDLFCSSYIFGFFFQHENLVCADFRCFFCIRTIWQWAIGSRQYYLSASFESSQTALQITNYSQYFSMFAVQWRLNTAHFQ